MRAWTTLSRHVAFDASPYLRVVREVVEVCPGQVIDNFWQVELRPFVVVVPMTAAGLVTTLSGYRHGPRRICLSLPGGFIDPGETPEQAVRRELVEETGLSPGALRFLGDFVDNGNQRGGHGHYFLALDCTAAPGMTSDPTEAAVAAAMTVADVDAALNEGRFGVIHHVAGWCLARRHPDFPPV